MKTTVSYPVGGSDFAEKALDLTNSIRRNSDEVKIVTGIREEEKDEIDEETLREIKEKTEMHTIRRSTEKYPISAKISTMKKASEEVDSDILIHLDSDVFVVDNIEDIFKIRNDKDFLAKPVDFGNQHYACKKSFKQWQEIANALNKDFKGLKYRSTIDNNRIPPYFNAGVVVSFNDEFPKRWAQVTDKVYEITQSRYSDQIALGLLEQEFKRGKIEEKKSYNLPGHFRVPENVEILRYEDYNHLLRLKAVLRSNIEETIDLENKWESERDRVRGLIKSYKFYLSLHYRYLRKIPKF
ncbi:glycosyltransferase [Candidatus Nanohalovita haloferacivicina]|uniref:glycosyltransferase n=1 Tax=Candidatus Nanohalovita haloferacivicina TaxID=2978046 RepID=UPI00325FBCED